MGFQRVEDAIAVEFERKKGDSIAFNKLFRLTRRFLCPDAHFREAPSRVEAASAAESTLAPPPPICSTLIDSHFATERGKFVQDSEPMEDIMAPLINIVEN